MKKTVYIHTNNKQRLGGKLAKFAIEKNLTDKEIKVEILNVDELQEFKDFSGKEYLRNGKAIKYDTNDLQSFTLSRFMPPELNNYEGRAIVIDPDIFSINDISPLFNMDLENYSLACCAKKDAFDTSMMVMDCTKLKNWNTKNILQDLADKKTDYVEQMGLKKQIKDFPNSIKIVSRLNNNLDVLTNDTVFLHTTNRITQPWSTGLPIDFKRNDPGKFFGLIPKLPFLKLAGKWPSTYQQHPDKNIEIYFLMLVKEALAADIITNEEMQTEVDLKRLRTDIFEKLSTV